MTSKGWTREPLVHFLAGGLVLFVALGWFGDAPDPASRTISVDRTQMAQLSAGFERTLQRPPTDAELDALVDRYVREEVLYREALRLGLDGDDPVIRKRLANKMDFLAGARAETVRPDDDVLQAWFGDNRVRFAPQARLSFDQLVFADRASAEAALARLPLADWRALGMPMSLPDSVEDESRDEVTARFGVRFSEQLDALDSGDAWQGPVPSGLGWHLVRLRERELGEVPPLEDIRERVENEWRSATIAERREKAYRVLRDAYTVDIDR